MNNTLSSRLIWARKRAGITQAALAEGLRAKGVKISQSTIASWESGGHMSGRKIPAVAVYLGVSPLWLSDGIGELPKSAAAPPVADEAKDALQALVTLGNLSEREAGLMARFRRLPEEYMIVAEKILDAIINRHRQPGDRRRK